MTSPPLITANITKNASNVPISLQFYKMFPIQQVFLLKNEKGAVLALASGKAERRQLHPLSDSGGIQTHDLQNFFSTKSFCSKIKKVQLRQLHPLSDSGGIQTHDLQNRNLTLYSAKLRNHCDFAVANLRKLFQTDERLLHKKRAKQTFS